MPRIALGIEYDGSVFAGWQAQAHAVSVQAVIEDAVVKVADHPVRLTAAGRTDAGVHATMQVAHFDAAVERSERAWVLGANTHLPSEVSVLWAKAMPPEFHARFSAQARSYCYVIRNRWVRLSLDRVRACWVRESLDAALMHEAAQILVGTYDFSSFRAAECQSRSPVRQVESLTVRRQGEYVLLEVTANGFLHHMVRNIAGVLIDVGRAKRPASWVRMVLEARDRRLGGVTAPPQGLYLTGVRYPSEFKVPQSAGGTWALAVV